MLHFAEAVLPKAISGLNDVRALQENTAAMGLVSRALFLCHALVISDFATSARIEKIQSLLLPLAQKGLESESIDLRETTENLLAALATHRPQLQQQGEEKTEEIKYIL